MVSLGIAINISTYNGLVQVNSNLVKILYGTFSFNAPFLPSPFLVVLQITSLGIRKPINTDLVIDFLVHLPSKWVGKRVTNPKS